MKIKFGAIVTEGRGKLGGHVAAKNRGGAYLRTKVTPTNGQTVAQMTARSILASYSQSWSALTPAERASFNAAVNDWSSTNVFGDLIKPSGKTLFVKLNSILAASGQPDITEAPQKVIMPILGLTAAQFSLASEELTLDTNVIPTGYVVTVSATAPQTAGTTYVRGRYRRIGIAPSSAINTFDFYPDYQAKFGNIGTGSNVFLEVTLVAPNGQTTVTENVKVSIVA